MNLNILPGTQGDKVQNSLNLSLPQIAIPIELSINTQEAWIYCNFPEHIDRKEMLADESNVRINRQVVSGNVQVFYSHFNDLTEKIRYGIRIYNPNNKSVTITPQNCGHSDKNWDDVCGGLWQRFFKGENGLEDCDIKSATVINPNKSLWIMDKEIAAGSKRAFSGNLRFHTTQPVAVSTYAYKKRSGVGDDTKTYPYTNDPQYSGLGKGYFLMLKQIVLKASELINKNGKYFSTNCNRYDSPLTMKVNGEYKSELIPIDIVGTGEIAGVNEPKPRHNVGNWCAQYYIPIRLENDLKYPVTFNGYLRTAVGKTTSQQLQKGSTFIISSRGNTTYGKVNNYSYDSWNWLKSTIPANDHIDDVYQFVFGTNSTAPVNHIFKAEKA